MTLIWVSRINSFKSFEIQFSKQQQIRLINSHEFVLSVSPRRCVKSKWKMETCRCQIGGAYSLTSIPKLSSNSSLNANTNNWEVIARKSTNVRKQASKKQWDVCCIVVMKLPKTICNLFKFIHNTLLPFYVWFDANTNKIAQKSTGKVLSLPCCISNETIYRKHKQQTKTYVVLVCSKRRSICTITRCLCTHFSSFIIPIAIYVRCNCLLGFAMVQ